MHENAAFVTAAACGCGAVLILCVIGLVLCPRDELVHASPLKVFWVDQAYARLLVCIALMCVACPSWARRPVDVGGGAGHRRGRLALVTAGEACTAFAALPYTAFSIYTNVLVNVANLMPMGDAVRLRAEGALAAAHAGGDFAQIIRCFVIWCSILYFVDMLLRKWNAPARQAEVEQGGLPTL